jgi:hypothetical protein
VRSQSTKTFQRNLSYDCFLCFPGLYRRGTVCRKINIGRGFAVGQADVVGSESNSIFCLAGYVHSFRSPPSSRRREFPRGLEGGPWEVANYVFPLPSPLVYNIRTVGQEKIYNARGAFHVMVLRPLSNSFILNVLWGILLPVIRQILGRKLDFAWIFHHLLCVPLITT